MALAEHVGGEWPARARRAARVLSPGGDQFDSMAESLQLLSDIRDAFGTEDTIFTGALLAYVNALDESPWGALRKEEGLDARGLAKRLRKFRTPEGGPIRSSTVRVRDGTAKGYRWDQFADAFARYLSDPSQASQASQPAPDVERVVTDVTDVTDVEGAPEEDRGPFRERGNGCRDDGEETLGAAWDRINAERQGGGA